MHSVDRAGAVDRTWQDDHPYRLSRDYEQIYSDVDYKDERDRGRSTFYYNNTKDNNDVNDDYYDNDAHDNYNPDARGQDPTKPGRGLKLVIPESRFTAGRDPSRNNSRSRSRTRSHSRSVKRAKSEKKHQDKRPDINGRGESEIYDTYRGVDGDEIMLIGGDEAGRDGSNVGGGGNMF